MKLEEVLPSYMARHLRYLLNTDDVIEALRKLCVANNGPLLSFLLVSISEALQERSGFEPVEPHMEIKRCIMTTDNEVLLEIRDHEKNVDDRLCYKIITTTISGCEEIKIRACTENELKKILEQVKPQPKHSFSWV